MMGKILHNRGFGPTTGYVVRHGAIYLGGNMLGRTAVELTNEFRLLHALRPDLKRPVVHLIGAFAPSDRVTDTEMLEIATKFMVGHGYEDSLHTIWRHTDGTTDHFHIVTAQMDIDGKVISQSFERYRNKRLCRELEKEYGLQLVSNIRKEEPKPPSAPLPTPEPDGLDIELPSVTTVVSDFLSRAIKAALPTCKTVGDLAQALHHQGIAMVPQVHAENGQVYGLGFRVETGPLAGSFISGSRIPGGFSPKKLVTKHGLAFDQDRDLPILRNPQPTAPPPMSAKTPQKPPKNRRKKKGDRRNARNQRKHSSFEPTGSGPAPWYWNGASPEIYGTHGPSSATTQLVGEVLANPYSRTSFYEPPHEPLFSTSPSNPWRLADHH